MRHMKAGRKLGVNPSHRIALLRSLTLALIEHDSIQTSPTRAKELRWYAERVVTLAKRGKDNVAARRRIVQLLGSTKTESGTNRVRSAVTKLYADIAPRFQTRPGGYTQILRLAFRRVGDNAEQCIIRYIPSPEKEKKGSKGTPKAKAPEKKAAAPKEDKKPKEKKAGKPQDKAPQDKVEDKPKKAKKEEKEGA